MGKLRKVYDQDVPVVSSCESADDCDASFKPNDYVEIGSYPTSTDISGVEGSFDKALCKFYLNHKIKSMKRKLSSAGRRNVRQKRSTDYPSCTTFTRYFGKFFSSVVDGMCPRFKNVIEAYGMGCLLNFVRTEVPLRLVKRLASRFDVFASEFQLKKRSIPVTKYDIHNILDLPVDGEPLLSDADAGRDFILSHFNLTSIPSVTFFANKLKLSEVDLSDEDIFICFMIVAFSSFLCPNSSLCPSPKYLHIFNDCRSVRNLDLSKFVYDWLLSSIKKFKDSTKVASKRSVTLGGCHYAFVVCYLDHLHFGLHFVPDVKPRILAWRGNKVKQFSELDRNNSRSYGKRPLKRLCPTIVLQDSVEKSSATKDSVFPPSSGLFAMTVHRSFGPHFGFETVQDVIELVQAKSKDKPNIFVQWSESLVIDVLDCVLRSSVNANTAATAKVPVNEDHSQNKFSFGAKPVSIQFVIDERRSGKDQDITSPVVDDKVSDLGISSPNVDGVVNVGDIHNPVLISGSSTAAKAYDQSISNQNAVPISPVLFDSNSEVPSSKPLFSNRAISSPGRCISLDQCVIPDVNSSLVASAGPIKKCEPKVALPDKRMPSFAELNRSAMQSAAKVAKDDENSFRALSPLVLIRLTRLFQNEVGDVACSQYVAEKFTKSVESPNDEVNQSEADVQIVGSSCFATRCDELTRSIDAAYNKLKNFIAPASTKMPLSAHSPEVEILSASVSVPSIPARKAPASFGPHASFAAPSPEVEILSGSVSDPSLPASKAPAAIAPCPTIACASGSLPISSGGHGTRRLVFPGRFCSDPYVAPKVNRFSPTHQEKRHHVAMCHIGMHATWCKYEAIRYDRAYCSYRSLATLKSKEHVDNFLILCVCRYLFNESHPSVSKKHFFFSYIGETILSGTNVEIVGNAFSGAISAFPMWRSDLLFFPIGRHHHWFSFVVCLKEKKVAFLDSIFGANSPFYSDIRDRLVENFINLWDRFVTPMMSKRIVFESFDVVFPVVPKQLNSDDCGVFTTMFMKHWSPRTTIGNLFGCDDIDNVRIKLANELYFSPFNSTDKTLVTNFFGDVQS